MDCVVCLLIVGREAIFPSHRHLPFLLLLRAAVIFITPTPLLPPTPHMHSPAACLLIPPL